ncbi:hypothetical protein J2S78_001238 [Salibacterium salarium]|uniref:DUF3603 family protein n=1 Tax=Salibacterium salarium TaxID=284579 RepID=UPI00277D5CF5|nr:DUF3603 family protein [Salibacterium salarium]MDQ0298818.1 hypothetical protein [Salibacterium salarium]
MPRIRDVWINWFEGEENGYNICPFHEWNSEDRIEVLDQAEIVKVTEELFDYIENRLEDLPDDLLNEIFQKSTLRKKMTRITLDYCFVMYDGNRVLAVDTLGYKTPIRKSCLTPKHERIVKEMMEVDRSDCFDVIEAPAPKEYHILSPHPCYMTGLTRKERQLKQLLFMALDQLYTSGESAEIRYWFTEWDPSKYEEIQQNIDKEVIWQQLYEEVKLGWSPAHYELCKKMIKGQPFFEKLWNMQHEEEVR